MLPALLSRTRPDAPRLDSDNLLRSSAERPAPLKAKRSHRKADPDAAHRLKFTYIYLLPTPKVLVNLIDKDLWKLQLSKIYKIIVKKKKTGLKTGIRSHFLNRKCFLDVNLKI